MEKLPVHLAKESFLTRSYSRGYSDLLRICWEAQELLGAGKRVRKYRLFTDSEGFGWKTSNRQQMGI